MTEKNREQSKNKLISGPNHQIIIVALYHRTISYNIFIDAVCPKCKQSHLHVHIHEY